ncbi:MAG: RagB/SusD family nutrient uptake outer membrane protein [Bacteroidales bacterium]
MKNKLSPEFLFSTQDGFESALMGSYSLARDEWSWNSGGLMYAPMFAGTDLCVTGFEHSHIVAFQEYGDAVNSSQAIVRGYWRWAYRLIANTSEIINQCSASDKNIWKSEILKRRVEAEARFLRAYAYYYLAYLYGDVPIVDGVSREYRIDFVRDSRDSVLQFAIDDLLFAEEHLAEVPSFTGQIVKAAAQHKLAELYLTFGSSVFSPESAEKELSKIIDAGVYSLAKNRFGASANEPGDVFSDLFVEANQNICSENIWVMQQEWQVQGGGEAENSDWSRRAWVPYYANINGMVLADSLGGRGLGRLVPLVSWVESYEASDMRVSKYNIRRNYFYNDTTNKELYGKPVPITTETIDNGSLYVSTTKCNYGKTDVDPTQINNLKDRIKIRLAETYLLLAEAHMYQGELEGAARAINEVRGRANATPILASDVDMDFILDERARELFAEYPRRITLIRTNTLISRVKQYNPVSKSTIKDFNVLWPIPQEVIDSNTGTGFPQNKGY